MNISNIQSNNVHSGTIFNMGNVRAQMREAAQSGQRGTGARFSTEMNPDTIMEPLTNEKIMQLAHAHRTDVNARLDDALGGRNYSSLTDSDFSRLAWSAWEQLHTPVFGEEQRGLAEMASFLEQKLNELDNDPSLSPERRNVLRQVWQAGFVKAVRSTERVPLDESIFRRGGGKSHHDAQADISSSLERANYFINNLASFTDNTEIRNLIMQGLEKMVTQTIFRNASAYYLFRHAQGDSQATASNAAASLRNDALEMLSSMRSQWGA